MNDPPGHAPTVAHPYGATMKTWLLNTWPLAAIAALDACPRPGVEFARRAISEPRAAVRVNLCGRAWRTARKRVLSIAAAGTLGVLMLSAAPAVGQSYYGGGYG